MNVLETMNSVVAYIEDHLKEEIDYQTVARIACYSEHHTKRMFSFIAGVSIAEYVRRRRLTLAGFDLHDPEVRIIDAAVKYGYTSADSFSRAFQEMHGVLPSTVKHGHALLKAYPRLTFQLTIQGDEGMKYTFVQQEAFSVVGKQETVVYGEGNDTFEPAMWNQIEAIEAEVKPYSNMELSGVLHLSFTNDDGDIDYMIAAATTQACPDHLKQWDIPAQTWAVFHVEGKRSENMLDTWERVYTEWFPISGYELAKAPEIIRGVEEGFEIWIPVQKGKIQN